MVYHPEGHPDEDSDQSEESMRILEGFLEPARLAEMLNRHQRQMNIGQNAAQGNLMKGNTTLAIFQQIFTCMHQSMYDLIILQIGMIKRMDHMCEKLDQIVGSGGEDWNEPTNR